MSIYRKPLAGGGHRIIPRSKGGQFSRFSIGAKGCQKCGAINIPQYKDERDKGGFVTKQMPVNCHRCGEKL